MACFKVMVMLKNPSHLMLMSASLALMLAACADTSETSETSEATTAADAPDTMAVPEAPDAITLAVTANAERLAADMARDGARHPEAFLRFLGLTPDMTVAEVNPGGGWYTRILAPFLRETGVYIGLEHHPDLYQDRYPDYAEGLRAFPGKVAANTALYGPRATGTWIPADGGLPIEADSVDAVIAVRALHNWIEADFFDAATDQVWQILKPGGVFGVVQHRVDEDFEGTRADAVAKGRWKQSDLIAALEAKGFELVEASEMNANPKDTKDYSEGVWTLPPAFELGDQDREKYAAIGESDRMTLKFKKVAR